jgi:hypothetical protein
VSSRLGWRGSPESGEAGGALGRGRSKRWPEAHPSAIGGVGRCGDSSNEPTQRCKVASAAAARGPERGEAMQRD